VTSPPHLSGRWWVAVAEGKKCGRSSFFARSLNAHSTVSLAETVVRTSTAIKPHQGAPIFTHPLHHPANATLFPAKSAQEPVESPVFL
jgi:hypothetical protein